MMTLLNFAFVYAIFSTHFIDFRTAPDGNARQADARLDWKTGRLLHQHLQRKISLTFVGAPLRDELYRFAKQQKVGLFIDRRVDPGIPLEMSIQDQTFAEILWQIADQQGLGVCQLGNFFYLGPLATSDALPIAWQEMKKESSKLRRQSSVNWNSRTAATWEYLSVPNELLRKLGLRHQFDIKSTVSFVPRQSDQYLPHDLWPEISLPDLPLDEQVALLLVGFGFWFERDAKGSSISIIPFPELTEGQIEFDQIDNPRNRLVALKQNFPEVRFSVSGKRLRATGAPEQLREVRRQLLVTDSRKDEPAKGGRQVYSLNIKASRGSILASIAQQTGRQFQYDPVAGQALVEEIQLTVEQVELEDLIKAVLRGSELKYELDNRNLRIH